MAALSDSLLRDMASKGIDAELTLSILEDYNAGLYDGVKSVRAASVPEVDGVTVIRLGSGGPYAVQAALARERLAALALPLPRGAEEVGNVEARRLAFPRSALEEIGWSLMGRTAFGVLNGGSATSYADSKKNMAFGQEVFAALEGPFARMAQLCRDKPKGLAPAFVQPDGSPGASFLLLKMRARLVAAAKAAAAKARAPTGAGAPFMPLFQMTSVGNDADLRAAYEGYRSHPLLKPLAERTGLDPVDWATGVQPMIAAYSHSSEGRP
ncbi:MAG: hypothetical protein Q8M76_11730, partial [Spirochaetaceae bacterium]|nr:hypothetical protein [Spirochaetaceae bacterium]